MKLWRAYLRQHRLTVLMLVLFTGLFAVSFALYGLPLAAVAYPAGLCALAGAGMAVWDFRRAGRRHKEMEQMRQTGETVLAPLPEMKTVEGQDCAALVEQLRQELRQQLGAAETRRGETVAYYTAWVHQIKTPIAAMRLLLQQEGAENGELGQELFRIEQYVDMALGYVRLDSDSSDFLLRRCDLDTILRPAVRKFAPQFIRRHLTLRYEPVGKTVLTDEKWLGFVIEQVLSNAVKYTPEGGTVTVSCTDAPALLISDTGIGVEPEDLPRVFEQGFTGYNGRADKKATGLGLYLCRRVCRKLGHTIAMDSRVGEGTTVTIGLARTEREHE